ncbi:MAG TPA: hypothetical protein VKB57_12525 [Acidimicrobiales bacterium]|nr:hypothetical protein [Acidimicrobiales bacterium]
MTDTSQAMQALHAHMAAEGALDHEAAVATTAAAILYEFPLQGQRFGGRDNARRFYTGGAEHRYRLALAAGQTGLPAAEVRARWVADDAMIVEAAAYPVMTEDGTVHTHPVGAVLVAGPDGVTHERIYVGDEMFGLLTAHVRDALEPM